MGIIKRNFDAEFESVEKVPKSSPKKNIGGAATKRWILKRLLTKTEFDFISLVRPLLLLSTVS
jgi:hypothetical protein